jgi:hypothetical protein
MENVTVVKALEGKYGYVGPYVETVQADGASFSESYAGLWGEANYDQTLGTAGTLSIGGWIQPNAVLKSAKNSKSEGSKIEVANKTGSADFALTEDGDTTIEQRDPSLFSLNAVNVKFKPAAVPGFSVGSEIEYDRYWKPKYAAESVDGDTRTDLDGYANAGLTTTKFILGYKINDSLSLTNSLRHMTGGFYEHRIDADNSSVDGWEGTNRWENRLILSATLL